MPVISDSLKGAPGKKSTSSLSNAKVFLGEVLTQFWVIPVIAHEINERRYGKRRFLAAREEGSEGIDRAVGRNEGRGRETLSDEDGDEGELLDRCEGNEGGTIEGDAGTELFSEGNVEGCACGSYRS